MSGKLKDKPLRSLLEDEYEDLVGKRCRRLQRVDSRLGNGFILLPCGSSRPEDCRHCAAEHRRAGLDVLYSGIKGDNARRVNACYFFYVTYTLPTFGAVHYENSFNAKDAIFKGRKKWLNDGQRKQPKKCRCGKYHFEGSGYAGVPITPATYRYNAAVHANSEIGQTFHYARKYVNAMLVGPGQPPIDYIRVKELQKRGNEHYHVIYCVPASVVDGLTTTDESGVVESGVAKVTKGIKASAKEKHRSSRGLVAFGPACDVQVIAPMPEQPTDEQEKEFKHPTGRILAYLAKYMSKGGAVHLLKEDASKLQREHYQRLEDAALAMGYKPKVAAEFGCSGHSMSKSKGWGKSRIDVKQARQNYRKQQDAKNLGISLDELEAQREAARQALIPKDGRRTDPLTGQQIAISGGVMTDLATGKRVAEYKYTPIRSPKTARQLEKIYKQGFSELDYVGSDSTSAQVERLAQGRRRYALDDLDQLAQVIDATAPSVLDPVFDFLCRPACPEDLATPSGALELVIAHDMEESGHLEALRSVRVRLNLFPAGEVPVYVNYLGKRVFMGYKGNSETQRLAGRLRRWRDLEFVTASVRE